MSRANQEVLHRGLRDVCAPAPTDHAGWLPVSQLHVEFTLVHRAATEPKYLAGSELGGGAFVNDAAPGTTAAAIQVAVVPEE